jgi:hypothetical protein
MKIVELNDTLRQLEANLASQEALLANVSTPKNTKPTFTLLYPSSVFYRLSSLRPLPSVPRPLLSALSALRPPPSALRPPPSALRLSALYPPPSALRPPLLRPCLY